MNLKTLKLKFWKAKTEKMLLKVRFINFFDFFKIMDEKFDYEEQEKLLKDGVYRKMSEICPYFHDKSLKMQLKTNLREVIDIGEKIEILTNYGNKKYYTITSLLDANKMHICGRREDGKNRGLEF